MLIPLLFPPQTRLWDLYLIARALGARLVVHGFRLCLEVRP